MNRNNSFNYSKNYIQLLPRDKEEREEFTKFIQEEIPNFLKENKVKIVTFLKDTIVDFIKNVNSIDSHIFLTINYYPIQSELHVDMYKDYFSYNNESGRFELQEYEDENTENIIPYSTTTRSLHLEGLNKDFHIAIPFLRYEDVNNLGHQYLKDSIGLGLILKNKNNIISSKEYERFEEENCPTETNETDRLNKYVNGIISPRIMGILMDNLNYLDFIYYVQSSLIEQEMCNQTDIIKTDYVKQFAEIMRDCPCKTNKLEKNFITLIEKLIKGAIKARMDNHNSNSNYDYISIGLNLKVATQEFDDLTLDKNVDFHYDIAFKMKKAFFDSFNLQEDNSLRVVEEDSFCSRNYDENTFDLFKIKLNYNEKTIVIHSLYNEGYNLYLDYSVFKDDISKFNLNYYNVPQYIDYFLPKILDKLYINSNLLEIILDKEYYFSDRDIRYKVSISEVGIEEDDSPFDLF